MNSEDIKLFFENYIKDYLPYKNEELYQSLSKIIFEDYLNEIYIDDPKEFKDMFEKSVMPQEVYDNLLIGIGLPKYIVNTLNSWDKQLFIEHLSNFYQNKGSIQIIKDILLTYDNNISVYELYLTYENGLWVFKPKCVHYDGITEKLVNNFSFQEVYRKSLHFFINETQLESMRINNDIVLPLKTNLLMLDFENNTSVSLINGIVLSAFMKQYKNHTITITFDSDFFNVSLSLINTLWFYLITAYFNHSWGTLNNTLLYFDYKNAPNKHNIYNIESIIDDYDKIDTESNNFRHEIDDYYFSNFIKYYETDLEINNNLTEHDLFNYIFNNHPALAKYIEKQLDIFDKNYYIEKLLSEIYYMVHKYFKQTNDHYLQKYGFEWLNYLPKLNLSLDQTAEYMLLQEMAPKHTEIINNQFSGLSINDKFNTIAMNVEFDLEYSSGPYTSSVVMSDSYEIFIES